MTYHHLPLARAEPVVAIYDAFMRIMVGIGDRQLLKHCAPNLRVTAFYGLYATKCPGWTTERADALIERVWGIGPDQGLNPVWAVITHPPCG